MNKKIIIFILLALYLSSILIGAFTSRVNAESINSAELVNVYYFYRDGCSHCTNVEDSGVLKNLPLNTQLQKIDIMTNEGGEKFIYYSDGFKIPQTSRGTPFLVIEKNEQYSYLFGDVSIINKLNDSIINFVPMQFEAEKQDPNNKFLLGVVIIGALTDSFNPCAFGVLIFLIMGLLSIGSSKRALKAGIIYSIVVFVIYFLLGLGILKILPFLESIKYFYKIIGVIVLGAALIEIKDFFFYGKGFSLKIPTSAKPTIEKLIKKGTLPAIILLGIFVSLVEAPCTGGPYLAVLSILSQNNAAGIAYLMLYNIIFILPLIVISFGIYYGRKIENLRIWVENNKRLMRLITGIIMVFFSIYLIKKGF